MAGSTASLARSLSDGPIPTPPPDSLSTRSPANPLIPLGRALQYDGCAMKVQRLRVTFARGDVLRYITHLDLMRSWERALKRAGLPLAYSEGFTRHPQIALAAPLPVGATAEAELMDVFLAEPLDSAKFRARLAAQTPPGLAIEAVEEVPLAWPSLQSLV